jgi:hypothetical protein
VIVQPLPLTDMHENSDRYTDTSHFSQQSSPALTPTAAASGSSKSKRLSWLTNAFKLRSRHHSTAAAAAAAVQAQNRAALGRSGSSSDLQNSGQLTAPAANSRSFFALEFPDDELEAVLQSNPQYNRTNPTPSTHSQRRSITTSASFGASGSGSMHRLRDGSSSNSASVSTSCHSAADAGARLSSGSWHNYTQHPQHHQHSSAAAADSSDAGSDSGSVSTVAGPPVTGHGVAWGVSSNNNSNNNSSSGHSNIGSSAGAAGSPLLRVPEMMPLQLSPQRRASVAGEEGSGVSPPGSPQKNVDGTLNRTYSEVLRHVLLHGC